MAAQRALASGDNSPASDAAKKSWENMEAEYDE
jgi:hypothetical protein